MILLLSACRPADSQEALSFSARFAANKEPDIVIVGPPAEPVTKVEIVPVTAGLRKPVYLTHAGDERLFVAEQDGRVRIIENEELLPEPFLDIGERLATDGSERGLLGLTFHPDYAENGYFYVVYTNLDGDTEVTRFTRSRENPNLAIPESDKLVLFVEQPYGNHNGGQLLFGPDGYLYIGLGDGGAVSDPFDNAQDVGTFLGAILRIEVDSGDSYAIPPDNPFVNKRGAAGEVWAYGLRNPFAFSFDSRTNDLYITDVGQEGPEEINFQPAGSAAGINYGWPIREGSSCYEAETCRQRGLKMPIYEYEHGADGCAIIGGHVYRGQQYPELSGNYFFSDFCSGILWALRFDPQKEKWVRTAVYETGTQISAIGEDLKSELYALAYREGAVYQIRP